MKAASFATALFILGLLVGCGQGPKLERPEINPPAEAALAGTYTITEETVSGQPAAKNTLDTARLEILPGGDARFVDFPLFEHRRGTQGIPRKTTCSGHWLISPGSTGYLLILDPDNEPRLKAVIVEGGDLILYYAPSTEGFFSKWRKAVQ
jgi:hypothetical protein